MRLFMEVVLRWNFNSVRLTLSMSSIIKKVQILNKQK